MTPGVVTLPNALTLLRGVLIGVGCAFLLTGPQTAPAIWCLALAGVTDFLDGYLARRLQQSTALGALLDPAVDRIGGVAVPISLAIAGIVPWWLVAILLARDVVVFAGLLLTRAHSTWRQPTSFIGKAATFALFVGLPMLALGSLEVSVAAVAQVLGWGITGCGAILYWWSALDYLRRMRQVAVADGVGIGSP